MKPCDDIKRFFMYCRRMDARIQARLEERDRCWALATKITPSYAGPPSGTGADSRVENGAVRLAELSREIDREVDALVDYRRLARRVILRLSDDRYRDVLTLRYFNGYSWEQVMERLHYESTQVWRLHSCALDEAKTIMAAILKEDKDALALIRRAEDVHK